MSTDIAKCPQGSKTAPSWEPSNSWPDHDMTSFTKIALGFSVETGLWATETPSRDGDKEKWSNSQHTSKLKADQKFEGMDMEWERGKSEVTSRLLGWTTRIKLPWTEVGRQQEQLAGDLFGLRNVDQEHTIWACYILERLFRHLNEMPSCIG